MSQLDDITKGAVYYLLHKDEIYKAADKDCSKNILEVVKHYTLHKPEIDVLSDITSSEETKHK